MTAAPMPKQEAFSASGFAAGPMRKPGAAHLMNWFYELPPLYWFLPFGGSRTPYRLTGPQPQYAPAGAGCQDRNFWAERGTSQSEVFLNGVTGRVWAYPTSSFARRSNARMYAMQ